MGNQRPNAARRGVNAKNPVKGVVILPIAKADNGTSADEGFYLYGFVAVDAPGSYGPIGLGGTEDEVFTVPGKNLSAVVSRTPVRLPLPEPDNILAHARVLETIMKRTTVVPAKFGTVFASRTALVKVMRQSAVELGEVLKMLVNKVELGLQVVWRKEVLRAMLVAMADHDPEIAELKREADKGNGFQIALNLGELVQNKVRGKTDHLRQQLLSPLMQAAVATRHKDVRTDRMIMNEAFLVDAERESRFDAIVEELAAQYGDQLEFNYSGPWPAFSFAAIKIDRVE